MGESMMPHVRMWERLQSSHVHLLGWVRTKIITPCVVKLHEGEKVPQVPSLQSFF